MTFEASNFKLGASWATVQCAVRGSSAKFLICQAISAAGVSVQHPSKSWLWFNAANVFTRSRLGEEIAVASTGHLDTMIHVGSTLRGLRGSVMRCLEEALEFGLLLLPRACLLSVSAPCRNMRKPTLFGSKQNTPTLYFRLQTWLCQIICVSWMSEQAEYSRIM